MTKILLYELTCPACGKSARTVFARVDGQATCEDCGHSYRVQRENLRHFRVVAAATGNSGNPENAGDPATVAEPACESASPPRQHAATGGDRTKAWSFPWRVQGYRTGAALATLTVTVGLVGGAWRLADLRHLNLAPAAAVAQIIDHIEVEVESGPTLAMDDPQVETPDAPSQIAKNGY